MTVIARVKGMSQIPSPSVLPFATEKVVQPIMLKVNTIANFRYLINRVAMVYCFRAFSSIVVNFPGSVKVRRNGFGQAGIIVKG